MDVAKLAQRMMHKEGQAPQSRKLLALKAAISQTLQGAEANPMMKMALPALNLLTSDKEVDDTLAVVRNLLEAYERELGNEQ